MDNPDCSLEVFISDLELVDSDDVVEESYDLRRDHRIGFAGIEAVLDVRIGVVVVII